MAKHYRFPLNLQFFAEDAPGVDSAPAAEEPATEETTEPATQVDESGVEGQAAAEPNNFEKAFAKRLAAAEQQWEAKKKAEMDQLNERLKEFDSYKKAASYLQRTANFDNLDSLNKQIELLELQERADREGLPLHLMQKQLEIEQREAALKQVSDQFETANRERTFHETLEKTAAEHKIDAKELHQFMYDTQTANFDIAVKAFKADKLEAELKAAKENAVKEYLESKKAPRVDGSGIAATQSPDTSKMSWEEIDRLAAARIQAANNPV